MAMAVKYRAESPAFSPGKIVFIIPIYKGYMGSIGHQDKIRFDITAKGISQKANVVTTNCERANSKC